jgi:hypothetical protein
MVQVMLYFQHRMVAPRTAATSKQQQQDGCGHVEAQQRSGSQDDTAYAYKGSEIETLTEQLFQSVEALKSLSDEKKWKLFFSGIQKANQRGGEKYCVDKRNLLKGEIEKNMNLLFDTKTLIQKLRESINKLKNHSPEQKENFFQNATRKAYKHGRNKNLVLSEEIVFYNRVGRLLISK